MNNTNNLKYGLSGLMRAKNEALFIADCIDSCINALDELIVVYNDCTDDTENILKLKAKQYPNKLKIFPFNHNILSHNLTKEEFELAISLPEDSQRLHSTQCNYALRQANYKYAVKIDPDQIYFEKEIKKWRDICAKTTTKNFNLTMILGWIFMVWISIYRKLSAQAKRPLIFLIPQCLVDIFFPHYISYAMYRLQRGNIAIALSGLNIFHNNGEISIPHDYINVHPPYNGEGDTVIFKINKDTYYKRHYTQQQPYKVTEEFNMPYKLMFAGPVWFHQHANRPQCKEKVSKTKQEHPELFIPIDTFLNMSYKQVLSKMQNKQNNNVPTLYQKILFAIIHKIGKNAIRTSTDLLSEKVKLA